MIDENNYKRYFLNLNKGILTTIEIEMLMAFLKRNPELEESLLSCDNYIIEPNLDINLNKNFLFKSLDNFYSVNENNFDEFCIAYYEKDLSDTSNDQLSKYLKLHPEKLSEFENYGKVYLSPQSNLKYPLKLKLKKITISFFYKIAYISSAAAVILFLIVGLIPSLRQIKSLNKMPLAVIEEKNNFKKVEPKKNSETIPGKMTTRSQKHNQANNESIASQQIAAFVDSKVDILNNEDINLKSILFIKIKDLNPKISKVRISFPVVTKSQNTREKADLYLSIKDFAIRKLHKNAGQNLEATDENIISWWDVTRLGVKAINKLTGSEIKVDRKINDEGKVTAMAIESGEFSFTRAVSK